MLSGYAAGGIESERARNTFIQFISTTGYGSAKVGTVLFRVVASRNQACRGSETRFGEVGGQHRILSSVGEKSHHQQCWFCWIVGVIACLQQLTQHGGNLRPMAEESG